MKIKEWMFEMRKIALIGCSAKKLGKNQPSKKYKAADIYTGKNFVKSKCKGKTVLGCSDEWYILSSEYGLVNPNDEIAYYDNYLGDKGVKNQREWAEKVFEQIKMIFSDDLSDINFVIFAGECYHKYLRGNLKHYTTLRFNGRHITWEIKEEK